VPIVVLLDKGTHNRKDFQCGVEPLDRYIRERAAADVKKSVAVCYVLTADDDPSTIIGYYTLSNLSVEVTGLPSTLQKSLPKYPQIPATLIGRLAVSSAHTRQGFGEHLLLDALKRAYDARSVIGSALVVVDAKDEPAASFYTQYDFRRTKSDPRRLYILMGTIAKLP
jgi:ribosomal protein S18 acetylase RimI-like enzyme